MPYHLDINSTDVFTRIDGIYCYTGGKCYVARYHNSDFAFDPTTTERFSAETDLTRDERDDFLTKWCEAGHTVNMDGKPWTCLRVTGQEMTQDEYRAATSGSGQAPTSAKVFVAEPGDVWTMGDGSTVCLLRPGCIDDVFGMSGNRSYVDGFARSRDHRDLPTRQAHALLRTWGWTVDTSKIDAKPLGYTEANAQVIQLTAERDELRAKVKELEAANAELRKVAPITRAEVEAMIAKAGGAK